MFFILVHLRLFAAVRHDFARVYLKTKKMTDISQTQAGFKAKSLGILCGLQGFLTQNSAVLVEID